jgi:putative membrane protein
MIGIADLPAVNAALNATSAVFLVAGYSMIRQKRVAAHAACMIIALIVSAAFLVSYLTYHAHVGHKVFLGHGWIRFVYVGILVTHTFLAATTAVALAPVTVCRAARRQFDRHKAIARWTLPIWLYVSVTGVIIYFMLYHWYANS